MTSITVLVVLVIAGPTESEPAAARPGPRAPSLETEPAWAVWPYRIALELEFEQHPLLTVPLKHRVARELAQWAEATFGDAWQLERVPPNRAAEEAFDKRLQARVAVEGPAGPGLELAVREYDAEFDDWTSWSRRRVLPGPTLGFELFRLLRSQYRPRALVTGTDGADALVTFRAQLLEPAEPPLPAVVLGLPMRLYRDFFSRGERVARQRVPWSYLVYRGRTTDRSADRCSIASPLRSVLSRRSRRKSRIVALGCPANAEPTTEVQFVNAADERPIAGHDVSIRRDEAKGLISLGNTDHEGKIIVSRPPAGSRDKDARAPVLTEVVLRTGKYVLARFPLVPGDVDEAVVRVRTDPIFAEVHGRILGLQEELLDTVARRAILNQQLGYHADKENVAELKATAEAINALPDRAYFSRRLDAIRAEAEKRSKSAGQERFATMVGRLFMQTEGLFVSYFRDEKVTIEVSEPANE